MRPAVLFLSPSPLSLLPLPVPPRNDPFNSTSHRLSMSSTSLPTLSSISSLITQRGYLLQNNTLGPLLNLSLIHQSSPESSIASLTGLLIPTQRLHIETFRASKPPSQRSLLYISPGMILFTAALAYANDQNINHVYGLAINDSPPQHRRLVRYLKRFGGVEVRRVTESLPNLPARIFYGGLGTIIRGDVPTMLARGNKLLQRSVNTVETAPSPTS